MLYGRLSYFAGSCGGASLETIRAYIEQQATPDDEENLTSRPKRAGFTAHGIDRFACLAIKIAVTANSSVNI